MLLIYRMLINFKILKSQIVLLLMILALVLVKNIYNGLSIITIQILMLPIITWIIINFYNNLFTYNIVFNKITKKTLNMLFVDFFIINFSFIFVSTVILTPFISEKELFIPFLYNYSSQVFFLTSFSSLTCIIFRNFEMPLIIFLSYYTASILGVLDKLKVHSVLFLSGNYFNLNETIPMIYSNIIYGVIFIVFSWMILDEIKSEKIQRN